MECKDLRRALAASVLVTLLVPGLAAAALIDAIEYYHAGLDHYFVTTNPTEIANLDNGVLTGWQRTGERFSVGDAATALPGGTPVCRFYGLPQFGLDSHFYSGSPSECAAVAQKFAGVWQLESSNVFQVYLPDPSTGACPADSVPVYRSWNGRADSNHRYTTSAAIQQAMVAKGYVAEGYGPASMPVAMCSPTIAGPVPTCTASASNANPLVGTSITVSASCSPAATSFVWTGCSSSSSSCTASSSAAGVVTYTVVGRNANGSSSPVSVSVAWTTPPPPPSAPTCALAVTTQTDPPTVGSTALISSGCSGVPSSYTWTNCSSGGPNCYVSETVAGPHTYTVVARNAGGASAPVSVTLDWQAGQPVAPDFCGSYPSILRSSIPWTPQRNAIVNSTSYLYPPGFSWDGAWVVRMSVPAGTTATTTGQVFVAEYNGPTVYRDVTISRFACDFRAVDPSGANGPVLSSNGVSAGGAFTVGSSSTVPVLQPGQTYYINVRNRNPDGSISCSQTQQRCDAFVSVSVPR